MTVVLGCRLLFIFRQRQKKDPIPTNTTSNELLGLPDFNVVKTRSTHDQCDSVERLVTPLKGSRKEFNSEEDDLNEEPGEEPAPPLTAEEPLVREAMPDYEPTQDLRDYKYPSLDLLEAPGSEKIVQDPSELFAGYRRHRSRPGQEGRDRAGERWPRSDGNK